MLQLYWPILLLVVSNTFYHICSKSTPAAIDPFASLTVTYVIGAICSCVLYFVLNKNADLLMEYKQLNWSSFVLGLTIVGLEVGTIYMYKVGWNISTGQLISSSLLAICLLLIGALIYKEEITVKKLIGIGAIIGGLVLVNI